jgi:hypothetical protein
MSGNSLANWLFGGTPVDQRANLNRRMDAADINRMPANVQMPVPPVPQPQPIGGAPAGYSMQDIMRQIAQQRQAEAALNAAKQSQGTILPPVR